MGGEGVKNVEILEILGMGFSIVENLSGLCGIILNLFRGSQLNFGKK